MLHPHCFQSKLYKSCVASLMTAAFLLSSLPAAFAGPGDTNSVNNGQIVQGGEYYNTPDSRTMFTNTGSGGLWVKGGTTVRGLEVDGAGGLTGNGGTLHFFAPGSVVRIDGTIDVNALFSKGGYQGNGGRVFIDSAFLYQNGNIFANGRNGGTVQFNVGSATFTPNSRVEAMGFGGAGGQVSVNASDFTDIQTSAVIDTSGKVLADFNTNTISVEASLINVEGVLQANGSVMDTDGGTIRLVAHGNTSNCFGCTLDSVRVYSTNVNGLPLAEDVFTQTEYDTLLARRNDLLNGTKIADGSIYVGRTGGVFANGTDGDVAGNGGAIYLAASHDIYNDGYITANGGNGTDAYKFANDGGNGGLISLSAMDDVINNCHISANGGNGGNGTANIYLANADNYTFEYELKTPNAPADWENLGSYEGTVADASCSTGGNGGNGGAIAIVYGDIMTNTGQITANGGNGGNGGHAKAVDTNTGVGKVSAFAGADAKAGDAGNGGDGGLIVVSGDTNPVGGGWLKADGGKGGKGGNAEAYAEVSSHKHAGAFAKAYAGLGGQGGDAGTVVAPVPASFSSTQNYSAKDGLAGHSGDALATAKGGAPKGIPGKAETWFGHADALAVTGDYGNAKADAVAYGVDASRARANATTGDYGTSYANAKSSGKWYSYSDAAANAGDWAKATSVADAKVSGDWSKAPIKGADARAVSLVGSSSEADATANAYSEVTDAEAYAKAKGDDFSKSTANATAQGEDWVHAKSIANTGTVGKSLSNATAIQHGSVNIDPLAEAYAHSGDFGTSVANANSRGNWYTEAKAQAVSGLVGQSTANSNAYSFIDQAVATSDAVSGDYGVSVADARAESTHRNKTADATANALSGFAGRSTAKSEAIVTHGWNKVANSTANAISGDYGTSKADAISSASVQWGTGAKAYSTANAKSGLAGDSDANASATSTKKVAKAIANAEFDTTGSADANATSRATHNSYSKATAHTDSQVSSGSGLKVASASESIPGAMPGIIAPLPPSAPVPPSPVNTALQQTNDNEIVVHNNNAVLMVKGGSQTSLNDQLASATVRSTAFQSGGATVTPGATKNLVATNTTGNAMDLDHTGYDNLNTITVLNNGAVSNSRTLTADDHVSVIANGGFANTGIVTTTDATSGSIYVSAAGDVTNSGMVATNAGALHGGSVIVKSGGSIVNNSVIAANATEIGGTVYMAAAGDIINLGTVSSDADSQAGIIVAKAGEMNINAGLVQANATGGNGGYVHLHADNVTANFTTVQANGGTNGGRVLLTAGDGDQSNNDRGVNKTGVVKTLFDAQGGDQVYGFSNKVLTPPVTVLETSIDTTLAESAYNFGEVNAQGGSPGGDGNIYLAGNNQFGASNGSHFNGVEVDVDGILAAPLPSVALQDTMRHVQDNGGEVYFVAGQQIQNSQGQTVTAVEAVACDAGPSNNEPDVNPNDPTRQGSQFPNDFTLPDPIRPPGGPDPENPDLYGLFQQDRPEPAEVPYRVVLALDNPTLFMATTYLPVTEEILALALDEYNRHLAAGDTVEESYRHTRLYLEEAGVDATVALAISKAVEEGTIKADVPVMAVIDKIVAEAKEQGILTEDQLLQ